MKKKNIKAMLFPLAFLAACLLYVTFTCLNSYISAFIILCGALGAMWLYGYLDEKNNKKKNSNHLCHE